MEPVTLSSITYQIDAIVWSWPTLIMCFCGWCVHWLTLYGRARKASMKMQTPSPGLFYYWYADWPSTVAASIIVFAGYFMLPEIAKVWPLFGRGFGLVADDGTVRGLSMFSAFMWGAFGAMLSDYAGRRLTKMVE